MDFLPALVAEVTEEERDFLTGVALAGGTAFVRVASPPVSDAHHSLELVTRGKLDKVVLFAQRAGHPTHDGCPLRLSLPSPTGSIRAPSQSAPPRDRGYDPPPMRARAHSSPSYGAPPAQSPSFRPPARSSPSIPPERASSPFLPPPERGSSPFLPPPERGSSPFLPPARSPSVTSEARPSAAPPVRGSMRPRAPVDIDLTPEHGSLLPAPGEAGMVRTLAEEAAAYGGVDANAQRDEGLSSPDSGRWAEKGAGHLSWSPTAMPSNAPPADFAAFLRRIAETHDPDRFAGLVAPMRREVPSLIAKGELAQAWRLGVTLDLIAREPTSGVARSRAAVAAQALEVYVDAAILGQLGPRALEAADDRERPAAKLLVLAGDAGARALYAARVKRDTSEARGRFVATLLEFGVAASPMICAALGHLEARLTTAPGAVEIAEDLLRGVAMRPDEATGQVLARYAQLPIAVLAHRAALALPAVAGARARPLLAWMASRSEDAVVLAALEGLRALGALDEPIVRKLEPLVLGTSGARLPVRVAAAQALATAWGQCQPLARTILTRALEGAAGGDGMDDFIVAAAKTLMTLGGDGVIVSQLWTTSNPTLRARLDLVVRGG